MAYQSQTKGSIRIFSPGGARREVDRGLAVVTGRADGAIRGVVGTCRPQSGGEPIPPVASSFVAGQGEAARYGRWLVAFRLPGPGSYEVTVAAEPDEADGAPADDRITIVARDPSGIRALSSPGLNIDYPEDDQDITAEKDGLWCWGEMDFGPLGTVEMRKSGGGTVGAITKNSPVGGDTYWSALFPALAAGTYDLRVENSSGSETADVTGLIVT